MAPSTRTDSLYDFLASRNLALVLFGISCVVFIGTSVTAGKNTVPTAAFRLLLSLLGLNLFFCTVRKLKTLSRPVLIIHSGTLLTLIGGLISSFGYVATVNTYEGEPIDRVYRWDKHAEVPLDFRFVVTKIHTLYYPIPVKVGVLHGKDKVGLFTLRTGESFELERYTVKVDELLFPAENLHLTVFDQGRFLGETYTAGENRLPAGFPYSFVLVAFKNPILDRTWLDIALIEESRVIAEGRAEVNTPFEWNGLYFYHVENDRDPYGNVYAGLQIVKDPGREIVFTGFAVMVVGLLFWTYKKFYRHPRPMKS